MNQKNGQHSGTKSGGLSVYLNNSSQDIQSTKEKNERKLKKFQQDESYLSLTNYDLDVSAQKWFCVN